MNNLLKQFICEAVFTESKKNKPSKNIIKGRSYKCIVKKTASKNLKKEIKKNHKNIKKVMVKVIVPDGPGNFSIIEFNKKKYMVKTSSLK